MQEDAEGERTQGEDWNGNILESIRHGGKELGQVGAHCCKINAMTFVAWAVSRVSLDASTWIGPIDAMTGDRTGPASLHDTGILQQEILAVPTFPSREG